MADDKGTPQSSDVAAGQAQKDEVKEEKAEEASVKEEMPAEEKKEEKKVEAPHAEEKKEETPKNDKKADEGEVVDSSRQGEAEVEVPTKFKKLVEEVEKMTVLELHELVKVLEKKFGVSAQAVAAAPGAVAAGDPGDDAQDSFTVELKGAGEKKIQVIKAIKEILGLGLKDAKDMVDGVPSVLKEGVKKEEAEEMKKKIEEAGGSVELK